MEGLLGESWEEFAERRNDEVGVVVRRCSGQNGVGNGWRHVRIVRWKTMMIYPLFMDNF